MLATQIADTAAEGEAGDPCSGDDRFLAESSEVAPDDRAHFLEV